MMPILGRFAVIAAIEATSTDRDGLDRMLAPEFGAPDR
jgi:hypothetical protein